MINLGDLAKDTVTGFEGICIARTEWLNGCARITLQPKGLDKDGKPIESHCFDEMQLKLVKAKSYKPARDTGGPRPSPQRRADPKR